MHLNADTIAKMKQSGYLGKT